MNSTRVVVVVTVGMFGVYPHPPIPEVEWGRESV